MASLLGLVKRALGLKAGRVAEHRAAGDAARARGAWKEALDHYDKAARLKTAGHSLQVRRGHVLKELGLLNEAETAYRSALSERPRSGDYHLHLGHVLKLNHAKEAALAAYQQAFQFGDERANIEILALAGRAGLKGAGDRSAIGDVVEGVASNIESLRDRLEVALQQAAFSPAAYGQMRNRLIADAPTVRDHVMIDVIVDGRARSPAEVLLTLYSLQDQSLATWSATVVSDAALASHPVASLAHQDPRIRFCASAAEIVLHDDAVVSVSAGIRLEAECLAWLSVARSQAGAVAAYGDHDHAVHDWRGVTSYSDPVLYGAYDEIGLEGGGEPPLVVLVSAPHGRLLVERVDDAVSTQDLHRDVLLEIKGGGICHVPALLATLCGFNEAPSVWPPSPIARRRDDPRSSGQERLLVIIPTRDQPDLLQAAVSSLIEKAERPDLLRIIIIDNRSSQEKTLRCFEVLAKLSVDIVPVDEPFNWARLNNLAVGSTTEDILLFANNDVEAVTQGWDSLVRRGVALACGGCVGAKLLYGDGRIQHAGVVLGGREGGAVHEGLDRPATDPGPGGRWAQVRRCAAVTGAFMAVSRRAFHEVGGFNERLPVAYSDLDFCLRCRKANFPVIYDPSIVIIHHESKTRGENVTSEQVAWDEVEMRLFYDIWREDAVLDPGRNPHWVTENRNAFDGLRALSIREILAYITRQSKTDPWSVS
ncbi:glycosyltransferase [Brevundimonas sp. PWP3-1b1]|uniref:glycosyltransferase family 2 protein n=1 Tax=unclassified Brevundimonas TaxID=2622653 RepID=UPI003CF6C5D1